MSAIEQERFPVVISVRGEQYYDGVDPDATELVTEGVLEPTEEGLRLRYQESELTGMEGTETVFEVTPTRVILRRTGAVNSQMVFEEGQQHTSLYETPMGELTVDIQNRPPAPQPDGAGRHHGNPVLHRGGACGNRQKQL